MENDCFTTLCCEDENLEMGTFSCLLHVKTNVTLDNTIIRINSKNKDLSKNSHIKYKNINE